MKLLLENFQAFINEQEGELPQIYCDMDGVLVDFEQGIVDQINKDLQMIRQMKDVKNLVRIQKTLDALGRDEVDIKHFRGSVSEAEKFNGWAAMIGIIAAFGSYATTGQLIPGVW